MYLSIFSFSNGDLACLLHSTKRGARIPVVEASPAAAAAGGPVAGVVDSASAAEQGLPHSHLQRISLCAGSLKCLGGWVGLIWNPKKLLGFFRHEAIGIGRERERENDPNPVARPPASFRTL